ncbi:hypothetical protein EKD16_08910 [Streptomonospora litoralis]|uniref:Uncharacterized protein n=1 Tax=Streptomonospora litoralis TaxID=2498135 RepID=A0A4P6PZ37_9ACTN|nr:hypothetical protein EKD16_08910 [Streptomonospora litoralis]
MPEVVRCNDLDGYALGLDESYDLIELLTPNSFWHELALDDRLIQHHPKKGFFGVDKLLRSSHALVHGNRHIVGRRPRRSCCDQFASIRLRLQ